MKRLALLLGCLALASCATLDRRTPGVRLPLRTRGIEIVDSAGTPVRLKSVNWFGAESGEFVVGGLDKQRLEIIAGLIRKGGFNSVRLPWSNELVERNPAVARDRLAANPELRGMRGLEILDRVVDALGRQGLMVILDNHRSRGDWCCDERHGDGLWYTREYPESAWLADWRTMAARYRDRRFVVAAELRNEIRPDPGLSLKPSWGDGNPQTDWRAAAMRGGEAVLAVNPRLLIIVGGIDYQTRLDYVRGAPVGLSVPNRLVYAAHDYAWNRSGAELADPRLFADTSYQRWGFVLEPGKPWSAPLYLSEFGGCTQPGPDGKPCAQDRRVFPGAMARYLQGNRISWAWWPLNGTQSAGYNRLAGAVEPYGLLDPGWSRYADPGLVRQLTK